jgi:hypothetical protein
LRSDFEHDPAVRREVEILIERQPEWVRTVQAGQFA